MRRLLFVAAIVVAGCVVAGCGATGSKVTSESAATKTVSAQAPGGDLVTLLSQGVRIKRLDNGLVLITKENRTASVVSVFAVVKAGGMLEGQYLGSGISHLTEHLVAGGSTVNRTEAQIQDKLDEIGAVTNAFTSQDRTAYFIDTMPEHLGSAVDLLSDWLQNAKIDPAEFQREWGVVQREILDGEDDPDRQMAYLLDETMYPDMPQGIRTIGYYGNIQKLTRDDVYAYYRGHYSPSNAAVCAAGDFDGAEAMAALEKAFAGWAGVKARPVVLSEPVPPVTDLVAVKEMDVRLTGGTIAYHSCRLSSPDLYPLDVLADILGRGESSRLMADLKTKRNLVLGIAAWNYTPNWPGGEFVIRFSCLPDKTDQVRAAVAEHLAAVCRQAPSADEVEKVKQIKISEQLMGLRTASEQARSLATDKLGLGDPYFSARYVENIQKVTPEDVLRVARKYLQGTRSTTAIVQPKSAAAQAAQVAPVPRPTTARIVLPESGLTLLVHRTPGQPAVSMIAAMKAGQSIETAETAGISAMTARYLERGTKSRSEEEIARFFDGLGGSLEIDSGWNALYCEAVVLRQDFAAALDVFADVVLAPAFAADKLASTRDRQLAVLQAMQSDASAECALYFDQQFFPGSPYRFPKVGTTEAIKAITADDVRDFYERVRVGRNMVVTIAGDVDPAEVERMVRACLASKLQPGQPVLAPSGIAPRKVEAIEIYPRQTQKKAAVVIVGYPGTDLFDVNDRLAMEVFDTICSGYYMPRGWLHDTLRGQSLVYGVHFSGRQGLLSGYYRSEAACQPENATRVARLMMDLVTMGRDYAYTEQEIARAKTTILTAREMRSQTPEGIAQVMTFDELYGLGYDFEQKYVERIKAVTADDVRRVASRFIGPPVVCITTPQPHLLDLNELRRPYDAETLKAMRAQTPDEVHQGRSHQAPQ
jgi:zinc protease